MNMQYCYEINVGLTDKNRPEKKIDKHQACEDFLKNFAKYKIDFSLTSNDGGYVHDDGRYVFEESLRVTIIGEYSKFRINRFCRIVKRYFHQESLLLVKKPLNAEFRS